MPKGKDRQPPHNRHLQLVPDAGARDAGFDGLGAEDPLADGASHAPAMRQIFADTQRNWWLVCGAGLSAVLAAAIVYGNLHLSAAHLKDASAKRFDARRFSVTVSVRHRLQPDVASPVVAHDRVRNDDAFNFVLHNRSHQNAYFGLFAANNQGQFFWFYPRDGGGVDLQTLPLPAIPTMTLPDGVVVEALSDGPLDLVAVFLPQATFLSELEADYAAGGIERLRQRHKADVQKLPLMISDQ